MAKAIELTNRVGATDAGAYDVRPLRRTLALSRFAGWCVIFAAVFIGSGIAYNAARAGIDDQIRRFKQQIISEELTRIGGAVVTDKELKLKLAQAEDENARLRDMIGRIAAAIEVER